MSVRGRLRAFFHRLAREHATSGRLAVAVAVGVVVGATPFYGLHVWIGVALARLLRLNQLAVFAGEQVSLPFIAPFLAFVSIQAGHLVLTGGWLSLDRATFSVETAKVFFADWLLGSLIVGALLACALGYSAYALLRAVRGERAAPGWTGRSRGNAIGYAIFLHTVRALGRRGGYALLWLVLPYYFVFARRARRASRRFLERRLGPRGWLRRTRDEWLHLRSFARSIVDTLLVLVGRERDFTWTRDGFEHIRSAHDAGEGVILLSAHVGSRGIGGRRLKGMKVSLVVYENEAEGIRRLIDKHEPEDRPSLILVNDGPMASVQIIKALRRGEVVAMLADRARGGPTLDIPFLGAPARFPMGPFLVAALSGAPVIITFGAKEGPAGQTFYARPPIRIGPLARDERGPAIQALAERFVQELEAFTERYPYQWYNFFDFWVTEEPSEPAG